MAASNNTIRTRIQLKSDTEANWNKVGPKDGNPGFIPLSGELIIYSADENHAFSRLKIGDGETNVVALPFIDSGTLNGEETEIDKYARFQDFPSPGKSNKLYVDLSTDTIYHFENESGYTKLSNFNFTIERDTINSVTYWRQGTLTEAKIENNTFKITNGSLPQLSTLSYQVVTNITKEGTE